MAMNNHLEVLLEDERWEKALDNIASWADKVFVTALAFLREHELGEEIGFSKPIFVNLALSNDAEIQKLNAEFRGKDKPTNVLSFASVDDDEFWDSLDITEAVELGDIIIALETLECEADEKKISLRNHFAHLLVHGILHLFGFDHMDDEEAEEMEGVEVQILSRLEIANPYTEISE